MHDDEFIQVCE